MRVIQRLDEFASKAHSPVAVALGNFDGIHLGHQAIFRVVKEKSSRLGGMSSVVTFHKHPQHVLGHKTEALVLTSLFQKLSLLEKSGIDSCFLLEFSKEFAEKSAEAFVKEILIDQIGAKAICMGLDARFGKDRLGNSALMRQLAGAHSFDFEKVAPVKIGSQLISSSLIRNLIQMGNLEEASKMLGRIFSFDGKVVPGSGRGTGLGFPTANLKTESEVLPPYGVYAVFANVVENHTRPNEEGFQFSRNILKKELPAVMNYGVRPTFGEKMAVIEIHILDSREDLKGKTLEIGVVRKIRDEKHFKNEKELSGQIAEDVLVAREILGQESRNSLGSKNQTEEPNQAPQLCR